MATPLRATPKTPYNRDSKGHSRKRNVTSNYMASQIVSSFPLRFLTALKRSNVEVISKAPGEDGDGQEGAKLKES